MDNNLAVATVRDLLPAGVVISASGLKLPAGLPWEDYEAVGRHLIWLQDRVEEARDTILWMIADWLQYGEFTYGEKFAQASDIAGRSVSRLHNIQWVGRSIPEHRRRPGLSFSHHEEVASLPPLHQDELLDRAEQEHLSSWELRRCRRELVGVKDYQLSEAQTALDNAATCLAALPHEQWAELVMRLLIRPLQHEVGRGEYRAFVHALFELVSRWRDVH